MRTVVCSRPAARSAGRQWVLNLLVTLDVLLAEGSVARAAKRLPLSPSAMSRTLSRLRETTGHRSAYTTLAMAFDWARFEGDLFLVLRAALTRVGRIHRRERFHAVALQGVYADGTQLTLPVFSVASERVPRDDLSCADWTLRDVTLPKRGALERALTKEATRGSLTHWDRSEARYRALLVRVTRRLRDAAPELLPVTDDFVCFRSEEDDVDLALLRRTVPRPLFERRFASAQRPRPRTRETPAALIEQLSTDEQEHAMDALVALGASAVPALIEALGRPARSPVVANVLAAIGIATPEVIGALRRRAHEPACAAALGDLGDLAWLERASVTTASAGLTARLTSEAAPLDYRPLEAYLAGADADARAAVEKALAPGSSWREVTKVDVEEALRALSSAHAVVRWHAASLLAEARVGKAVAKRIVEALASALTDGHPTVRRLALVSLNEWGPATAPHRRAMNALRRDPDPMVRRVAGAR